MKMFTVLLLLNSLYSSIYCINIKYSECPVVLERQTDIDTVKTFPNLNFKPQVSLQTVAFWNNYLETRYKLLATDKTRPELKVFVVPHSHNDPGWLKTFEDYYNKKTKNIIQNIVQKLGQFSNMTFVWNEVIFLEKWWSSATPAQQKAFKKLINEGRLEITTGGWVMPDEACTHIYSLLDQYIEGHEWLRIHLGVTPKTGWSIDPFGHGPTVPYLLDRIGIEGTIIQRIHYGWKQWFAEQKYEDFYWATGWSKKAPTLLVHNMPLEIYSVPGSCGPHPSVCEQYEFNPKENLFISDSNIWLKADTLMEEYRRLGSLTEHNVVLVPLGGDFSYTEASEFDNKYKNYQKLFDYVNAKKQIYHAHVQFGTPKDFFKEIMKNNFTKKNGNMFPTLKGDFFPYSDLFSTGRAQFWTGFYTTNPYTKILARKLEHQLRTSEILFSLAFNSMNCAERPFLTSDNTSEFYKYLVEARRNLGLFQHHDAITGTSKKLVMLDYGKKLVRSFGHCLELQEGILSMKMKKDSQLALASLLEWKNYSQPLIERDLYISKSGRDVVLFNSLVEEREVIIDIVIDQPNVEVYDNLRRIIIHHQINPLIEFNQRTKLPGISSKRFHLIFLAKLPALTAVTYSVRSLQSKNKTAYSKVFSDNFVNKKNINFEILPLQPGDIVMQNSVYKITFNRQTGFMKEVYRKDKNMKHALDIEIGAYRSDVFESGAYLFKPAQKNPEIVINNTKPVAIIKTVGPITTEIMSVYLPLFVHEVKIINSDNIHLSRAINLKNVVQFEENIIDTEMFMRFDTDIKTGQEFYTDQNGFQYQKRVRVKKLGIEGNYYPLTTMAWIQDKNTRLTYITEHAQGASSFLPGRLEVMLHRTIKHDDGRGLQEGILDNKQIITSSYLIFESIEPGNKYYNEHELPSTTANHLSRNLNYPVNIYFNVYPTLKEKLRLQPNVIFAKFPTGIHLISLRTITANGLPSHSCYMVLHKPGYSCRIGYQLKNKTYTKFEINQVQISNITEVSLTGLKDYSKISNLEQVQLDPMELKTYRINFASNSKCNKK